MPMLMAFMEMIVLKDLAIFALTDPATQWLGLAVGFGFTLLVALPLGVALNKLFGESDD